MKKQRITLTTITITLLLVMLSTLITALPAKANLYADDCPDFGVHPTEGIDEEFPSGSKPSHTVTFDDGVDGNLVLDPNKEYWLRVADTSFADTEFKSGNQKLSGNKLNFNITSPEALSHGGLATKDNHYVYLYEAPNKVLCFAGIYTTVNEYPSCPPGELSVYQERVIDGSLQKCYAPTSCIGKNNTIKVSVTNLGNGTTLYNTPLRAFIGAPGFFDVEGDKPIVIPDAPGKYSFTFSVDSSGEHSVELRHFSLAWVEFPGCKIFFNVSGACDNQQQNCQGPPAQPHPDAPSAGLGTTQICNFVPAGSDRKQCLDCFNDGGIITPFGCMYADPQRFIETVLKIAINIAGGIAFLMILYGGYACMTSAGNPEKLNSCKEVITSAIAGLLLIVFSAVILNIIGIDILGGFPGFGG